MCVLLRSHLAFSVSFPAAPFGGVGEGLLKWKDSNSRHLRVQHTLSPLAGGLTDFP